MPGKELTVSVSKDGDELELTAFAAGTRIEATGTLTFRKTGDNLYFNFHADTVNLSPESNKDAIEGTLEFKGTVGKGVDEKTDKKGGKYVSFSAYSTEKSGDALQFTWVRFIKFDYVKEAFLEAKAKIHATGKLTVSAYNGRIDLDCRGGGGGGGTPTSTPQQPHPTPPLFVARKTNTPKGRGPAARTPPPPTGSRTP